MREQVYPYSKNICFGQTPYVFILSFYRCLKFNGLSLQKLMKERFEGLGLGEDIYLPFSFETNLD